MNIGAMLPILGPLISQALSGFFPDPTKRDEATQAILAGFQQNEQSLAEASSAVARADSESESALTRMARPAVVIWSLGIISTIVGEALFAGQSSIIPAIKEVPDQLWTLIYIGIGGYMALRTVDKAVQTVVNRK
jgi:hypothetical protein